ncbi:hypothetical protein DL769_010157 [Monosporascus sp. CRB-8-3]|nr:hypothetical protein DL769_010157 [Monosporascus sp. CRB-8-3]
MASPKVNETPTVSSLSDDGPTMITRRSSRARKAVKRFEDDDDYAVNHAVVNRWSQSDFQKERPKERPKRKAAVAAAESIVAEDAGPLLQEILAEMTTDERKEYKGWVELESEPGFFNAMLQDLGAQDFKVQEVFGLDEMALGMLSKPVHGLIFLYQYIEGPEPSQNRQQCPDHLWFANQTTANACATLALMNIIMNAEGVAFGTELQQFKDSTRSMPPAHRGHMLDVNDFIRAVHNSVARRIDLAAEDLLLDNKYEIGAKRKKRGSQSQKKGKKPVLKKSATSRKKSEIETPFHYIAYVPVNGQVWELDGFETQPLCIGSYEDSWLDTVSPAIQNRMMLNEALSYNLLAVCQSPLTTISRSLAANLAGTLALHYTFREEPTWTYPDPLSNFADDARLAQFGLTRAAVASTPVPPAVLAAKTVDAAKKLMWDLRNEREALEAEHAAEIATVDEAVSMIRGRQRDYTPAIHEWLRVLAEKGVLRELITEIDAAEGQLSN